MSIAPSSKRVYRNFPGTNGFNYSNSEWSEIGADVYLSNTKGTGILFEPAKFKSYIQRYVRSAKRMRNQRRRLTRNAGLYTTNVPNYSNNRGFEIYVGDKAKWYKWPTSEQISNLHQSFRTYISNNNSNNNAENTKPTSLVERNLFNALNRANDQKSIRRAYLKGVLKLHPNKGGDMELFKNFKAKYILKKKVTST
jgi:hypothetical protein